MNGKTVISWIVRIIASAILFQTLYLKFTAHPQSVALFTKLGTETWGRIVTGIIELITGILLLIPSTAFLGALLGTGIMCGAILGHLTVIGIEFNNDGGYLFYLALVVMICCLISMWIHRDQASRYFKYNS